MSIKNRVYRFLFKNTIPYKKYNVKFLFLIFFTCALTTCKQKTYNQRLVAALELAGSNRSELEKVLEYYSQEKSDSLKLKAAEFLICNMDVHYSYKSKSWDNFQIDLDSLFKNEDQSEKLQQGFDDLYHKYSNTLTADLEYISDLQHIRADFLIQSIDAAFNSWKSPYSRHLSFDDFCEYILPYRAGRESLSDWRVEFQNNYIPSVYERLIKEKDSITAIDLCNAIKAYPYSNLSTIAGKLPDYNAHTLSIMRIGNCRQYTLQGVLAARYLGIPVSLDFTPQWATRSMGHEWNALINNDGKPLSFGIGDNCNLGEHIEFIPDRIPPKIYRQTFAKQNQSLAMMKGKEEIPQTLASPCIKDVTMDYYTCVDVPIKFDFKAPGGNKFSYLAVFDNSNWIPVCWAPINQGMSLFENLNKNILCLPGYYYNKEFIPAASPIIIDHIGNIKHLKIDLQNKQDMLLSRKYQNSLVEGNCREMVGGKFQVSNNPNFTNAVDLAIIMDEPEASYQIVYAQTEKSYKYFRYLAPAKSIGTISELEVYEVNSSDKLTGKIIGTEQKLFDISKEKAFDGDPLTSFRKYGELGKVWVGLEFDSPKRIKKIVYLPGNDDNCIRDGELYELFYWNNKWVSLGKQTGSSETYKLRYENVPTNTLYLLRNLTKGKEERIFTYEKGKQIWW
ncbi:MAG: discoidin domain-containing protein [Bacteroidales bacterium]|jgi:hypothetical protein|nr:discoidin domain-containing protein [Bacteroidales bacterium]